MLGLAGLVAAFAGYRRWHLRWGASDDEVGAPMPGDGLLDGAQFYATRALTIDAPPAQVWPWLVQVGVGRAGFYTYDLLDNKGRRSADQVLPEWQHPHLGDQAAPMTEPANDQTSFRLAQFDEPEVLVWAKTDSTWSWRLTPVDAGRTRLVTRLKQRYDWSNPAVLMTLPLLELGDFPMMRRMLLGVRERAER
jgi:hypothetical protein